MSRPEDSRVKIPGIVHLTRLGYTYKSIKNMTRNVDYDGDTNIFFALFRDAINRINNIQISDNDLKRLINELNIKLNNEDLGKAFFKILLSGFDGIKLIDFLHPENNSFTVVTELPYESGEDNFRPDIIILINGMPLSFVEVKRQNNREGIIAEHERMTRRFSNPIYRKFVNITQYTVFSNNNEYDDSDTEPIQGAFYATSNYGPMFFSRFREEQSDYLKTKIQDIDPQVETTVLRDNNLLSIKGTGEYISSLSEDTPTNRILTSLYLPERVLFLLNYGICYKTETDKNGITTIQKHIMRYPQVFATKAISARLSSGVKKGIIWHTQGSGKTALAYSNVKYLQDYYKKNEIVAKFFFIVDRIDLATQAKNEFEARGLKVVLVDSKEGFKSAIKSVGENNSSGERTITVVNIQKFSSDSITKESDYNISIQRVYFLDEAHRSYNIKYNFPNQ